MAIKFAGGGGWHESFSLELWACVETLGRFVAPVFAEIKSQLKKSSPKVHI